MLRAAVDEGLIARSPAARVGLPRTVAKPVKEKDVVAWTADDADRFLEATKDHRWAIAFRLGVLYGLRRSEVLALKWDDLDPRCSGSRRHDSTTPNCIPMSSSPPRSRPATAGGWHSMPGR
ncbi:MAG: hypothetical protein WAS51_15590 [Ilumatobacteraceae bacterium]